MEDETPLHEVMGASDLEQIATPGVPLLSEQSPTRYIIPASTSLVYHRQSEPSPDPGPRTRTPGCSIERRRRPRNQASRRLKAPDQDGQSEVDQVGEPLLNQVLKDASSGDRQIQGRSSDEPGRSLLPHPNRAGQAAILTSGTPEPGGAELHWRAEPLSQAAGRHLGATWCPSPQMASTSRCGSDHLDQALTRRTIEDSTRDKRCAA